MSTAEKEEEQEQRDVAEHARLPARTVYQIVSEEGRDQMERPGISLWWSGFAAGLSISFSLLSQAILTHSLPNASRPEGILWRVVRLPFAELLDGVDAERIECPFEPAVDQWSAWAPSEVLCLFIGHLRFDDCD